MTIAAKNQNAGLSVADYIDLNARRAPDGIFVVDPHTGRKCSFAECKNEAQRIASVIREQGVNPGEPVAYAFANSSDAALAILGLLYGGFLATAINLVAGENNIAYVLEHSGSKLVLADDGGEQLLNPIVARMPNAPDLIGLSELMQTRPKNRLANLQFHADEDGLLMYTSGTTGQPKGVILTQSNLLAGGTNTMTAHQLSTSDRGLCVLPLYHINAFCVSLMASLVSGSGLVIPSRFSASSFWDTIADHECSWFSVVPTQISYLLHNKNNDASRCKKLRFGRSASAPLSPDMHATFEKRFDVPIIETMGLTETAAQILANPLPPGSRKIGSPGTAFGNEVIIADDFQKEVSAGLEGEILVRGPNVLRCYLRNEKATSDAITKDGWLRTGDLGRMDEDGYVFVTGRLKELIIKGGENIAPREVDEALYSHPDVIEAAAFAVPCENYGQRIEAGVKLKPGSGTKGDDLVEVCREKIGAFKAPDCIHILPDLPKGPSGKIQRIKLAKMLAKS
ncbi:MAG: AMP-binding protein [Rhizobiaceae bacterium]